MILKETLTPRYPVRLAKKNNKRFYEAIYRDQEYQLPGVTSILSIIGGEKMGALIGWNKKNTLQSVREELKAGFDGDIEGLIARASRRPIDTLNAAADFGTRLHAYADKIIKGEPIETCEDDLKPAVSAFETWLANSGIEIIAGDTAVASIPWRYGGKFDFIFKHDGIYGVGDFKTSNAIHDEYALQVAAYASAAEDTFNINVTRGLIVRFEKTLQPLGSQFETRWITNLRPAFNAFIHALHLKNLLSQDLYAKI